MVDKKYAARKLKLLRRHPVVFAKMYWRNCYEKVAPLANPPGYVEPRPIPLPRKLQLLRATCTDYVNTWKPEVVPPKPASADSQATAVVTSAEEAEPESKLTHAERVAIIKDMASDIGQASKMMQPALQSFARTRAEIAREALQQFMMGYRDGKKVELERLQTDAEEWQAHGAADAAAAERAAAATRNEALQQYQQWLSNVQSAKPAAGPASAPAADSK